MLRIEFTSRFKKDYKTMVKRGVDPKKLEKVLVLLSRDYEDKSVNKNLL